MRFIELSAIYTDLLWVEHVKNQTGEELLLATREQDGVRLFHTTGPCTASRSRGIHMGDGKKSHIRVRGGLSVMLMHMRNSTHLLPGIGPGAF